MTTTSQIVSINPATEEVNATFEPTPARNVDRALERAAAAAQTWRTLPVSERAKSLFAMADALRANRERLARHITQDMGKPLLESRAEVDKSAWCCEFYAEHGPAMLADQPVSTSATRSYVSYEPLEFCDKGRGNLGDEILDGGVSGSPPQLTPGCPSLSTGSAYR